MAKKWGHAKFFKGVNSQNFEEWMAKISWKCGIGKYFGWSGKFFWRGKVTKNYLCGGKPFLGIGMANFLEVRWEKWECNGTNLCGWVVK